MLDPSISLAAANNAPQVNVGQAATTGLTLQNLALQPQLTQAQIANTQQATSSAQTAQQGQQIQNTQAQRELDAKVAVAQIMKNKTTVDPASGNVIPPNMNDVAAEAARQGLDPGTVFTLLQSGQLAAQQGIKTGADAKAYADTVGKTTQDLLRTLDPNKPEDTRQAINVLHAGISQLSNVLGPDQAKQFFSQRFGTDALQQPGSPATVDSNGNPVPATAPPPIDPMVVAKHAIRQAGVNAAAESISPQQTVTNSQNQQNIDISRESTAQAGAGSVTSPQARDPSSPISKTAQDQYIAANNITDPAEVARARSLSAADIQHQTGTAGTVAAAVVPQSTKSAAAAGQVETENRAKIMDQLANAAAAAKAKGLGSDVTAGNILQGLADTKLASVPEVQNYKTLLGQAKAAGIDIDMGQGPDAVGSFARNQAGLLRKQAGANAGLVTAPTFNKAAATTAAPAQAPASNYVRGNTYPFSLKNGQRVTKVFMGGDPKNPASWK